MIESPVIGSISVEISQGVRTHSPCPLHIPLPPLLPKRAGQAFKEILEPFTKVPKPSSLSSTPGCPVTIASYFTSKPVPEKCASLDKLKTIGSFIFLEKI